MKTIAELKSEIDASAVNMTKRIDVEIATLLNHQKKYTAAIAELENKLPFIAASLEQQGLGITSVGYFKTGHGNEWDENTGLKVTINAEPTSGKFKFIADAGYTARGSGKNQDRLNAKAAKLAEAIKTATGIKSVDVNPFSLEVKNSGDTKRVLIDAWIYPAA